MIPKTIDISGVLDAQSMMMSPEAVNPSSLIMRPDDLVHASTAITGMTVAQKHPAKMG